jgi:hypothetical protein
VRDSTCATPTETDSPSSVLCLYTKKLIKSGKQFTVMIVPRAWIINSLLSTVIALTCAVGDKKFQTSTKPLLKAFIDNSTHGAIGFFSAIIAFWDHRDWIYCLQLSAACLMMSSLIDADHFIAARSLTLSVIKIFLEIPTIS